MTSMQAAIAATQQTFATAESTVSNPVHAPTTPKNPGPAPLGSWVDLKAGRFKNIRQIESPFMSTC